MNQSEIRQLTDEQLIVLILKDGKKELFSVLYSRYFLKVQDKCFSFLKNKPQAEEFANDILSKAFEKLDSFKGKSQFSSWLYSLSYNAIIDYLRKKKQLHYPNWNQTNELPEIIDESESEAQQPSYEQLLEIFEKIHPEEKALLLMKYQDALSLKEIAGSLSISEDAVKMRLKRARSRVIYLHLKLFGNE
jgi:RNA polymerase sigma-70 factor (ECF subfamily)